VIAALLNETGQHFTHGLQAINESLFAPFLSDVTITAIVSVAPHICIHRLFPFFLGVGHVTRSNE
jgi:ethanolamine transporter EutH